MRIIAATASGITSSQQTKGELLIGDNDVASSQAVRLNYIQYTTDSTSGHATRFLAWIKTQIKAGYPVTIGVYIPNVGNSGYDHIVTVFKIESLYDDTAYHADDYITFEDHGVQPDQVTKEAAQYFYRYRFDSWQATRSASNSGGQDQYFLPSDTGVQSYGIAHTGVTDTANILFPVRVATSLYYETNLVDGSNTMPTSTSVTLTITIGSSKKALVIGTSYTVYKYTDHTTVPTSGFNTAARASTTVFTATGSMYTYTETIQSSTKAFYRALAT